MSKRVEEYIKNYTRRCSNEVGSAIYREIHHLEPEYSPWLTPDHARRAVEIAREEVIEEAAEWMKLYVINHDAIDVFEMEKEFKKAMEDNVC